MNAQNNSYYKSMGGKEIANNDNNNSVEIIKTGKISIKNKIDYYYLRMGIGIAYYNRNNYRKAIEHFEKALKFSSDDNTALEYLYYSYLFSGREDDAKALTSDMNELLINKIGYLKNKIIESVYAEGGYTYSNNINKNDNIDLLKENNIYGEKDLNNNTYYSHIGLKSNLNKKASIYFGLSYINIEKQKHIQALEDYHFLRVDTLIDQLGAKYPENIYQTKVIDTIYKYHLQQYDFYINSNIRIMQGLTITPAFHLINVSYTNFFSSFDTIHFYAQSYDTQIHFPQTIKTRYNFNTKDTSFYNYSVSLSVSKDFSLFTLSAFASYSNLNNKIQRQTGLSFITFPFGNLNLYTVSTITLHVEDKQKNYIFDQAIGKKLLNNIWVEANLTYGDLTDYSEKNAFVVYNVSDKINYKTGLTLIYAINKKIELSLRHQYIERESFYYSYSDFKTKEKINNKYINQTILGGFKYKL